MRLMVSDYLANGATNITVPFAAGGQRDDNERLVFPTDEHIYNWMTHIILPSLGAVHHLNITSVDDNALCSNHSYITQLVAAIVSAITRNKTTLVSVHIPWKPSLTIAASVDILTALTTCNHLRTFQLLDNCSTMEYRTAFLTLVKKQSQTLESLSLDINDGITQLQAQDMLTTTRT
jgi:hypothetical protein